MRVQYLIPRCFACLCSILTACSGDALTDALPEQTVPEEAYWSLESNYRAVNLASLAPYNTVQLTVTPKNVYGDSIVSTNVPTFTVLDTTRLGITPDGFLRAKATGSNLLVLASLQIGTVTHVDTVFVTVTATPPAAPVGTFSIQPIPPDSAIWSWGGDEKVITPVVRTTANATIRNPQVGYKISNVKIASVENNGTTKGVFSAKTVGKVWVIASSYLYGVHVQDSVEFSIFYPAKQLINVDRITNPDGSVSVAFYPSTVTIGVGGVVVWDYRGNDYQWSNVQSPGIDFEFSEFAKGPTNCIILDDAETCKSDAIYAYGLDARDGNSAPRPIIDEKSLGSANLFFTLRTWNEPGTYKFQDSWGQKTGTVIVMARPNL